MVLLIEMLDITIVYVMLLYCQYKREHNRMENAYLLCHSYVIVLAKAIMDDC